MHSCEDVGIGQKPQWDKSATCSGGDEVVPLFVVVVAVSKLISFLLDFYLVAECRILPIIICSGNINLYFYQKYVAITIIYGFNIIM